MKGEIEMGGFPVGMIALLVVSVLIYFGLAQRVLDRMQLSDKAALGIIAAMIVGSFINIPITTARIDASINVGGGIIPIALAVYLLFRAGTSKEIVRALGATVLTAAVIYLVNTRIFTGDPWQRGVDFIDPVYVYPLVAGVIAYLVGRSRRSAFIAATLGVLTLDVVDYLYLVTTGTPGTVAIGGAGAFDAVALSGIIAVLLAELVGETRERLQGGPESRAHDPALLKNLEGINTGPARKPEAGPTWEKQEDQQEEGGHNGQK